MGPVLLDAAQPARAKSKGEAAEGCLAIYTTLGPSRVVRWEARVGLSASPPGTFMAPRERKAGSATPSPPAPSQSEPSPASAGSSVSTSDSPSGTSRPVKEEKRFPCDVCGALFGRMGNMRVHRETHFATEKSHACDSCGARFGRIYELKRHVKTAHVKAMFSCENCGQEFTRSDALVRHQKRTEGGKPCMPADLEAKSRVGDDGRTCLSCAATFSRRDALMRHIKRTAGGACKSGTTAMATTEEEQEDDPQPVHSPEKSSAMDLLALAASDGSVPGPPAFPAMQEPSLLPHIGLPNNLYPGPFMAFPILQSPPIVTFHDLYPTIPSAFLPAFELVSHIISTYARYDGILHHTIHFPTFYSRVQAGTADPGILICLIWSTLRLLDDDGPADSTLPISYLKTEAAMQSYKTLCMEWLYARLRLLAYSTDIVALENVVQGLIFARSCALGLGDVHLHSSIQTELSRLFPRLRLGELEIDGPQLELDAWIRREERRRIALFLASTDVIISDSLEVPRSLVVSLFVDPITGVANEPWANLALPVTDTLFDLPDPRSPDPEVTLGLYLSWAYLPISCPARTRMLEYGVGRILESGYTATLAMSAGIWRLVQDCVSWFADRRQLICFPKDDEGRKVRAASLAAFQEIWANLPTAVRDLDAAADGPALNELTVAYWGPFRSGRLLHLLIFFHSSHALLHSPYDILATFLKPPPRSPILDTWPESPDFVAAEAHAIAASRLVRGGLMHDGKMEVRTLPPVWPTFILRACWVHVVAIRKLRAAYLDSALEVVSGLLHDVSGALLGMSEYGEYWRHTKGAVDSILGLLEAEGDSVWMRLGIEEAGRVKGLGLAFG